MPSPFAPRALAASEREALAAIVGERHLLVGREALDPYARDAVEGLEGFPDAVARPRTTEEVSRLLAFCDGRRIPVTPQAGHTGLSGGAVPLAGGLGLSLARMDTILEVDTTNLVAVVEAGVITQRLHEAVSEAGLFYPPDPSSRGTCTIGGNVAENAGGPHAAKYGVTGRWVLGLEAVLASGAVIVTGGKTRKDVAGYDLTSLLVGSEGTLAVVTKAWLRLIAAPRSVAVIVAPFPTLEQAANAVVALHAKGLVPAACEFVDRESMAVTARRKGTSLPFPEAEARLLVEFDGGDDAEVERDVTRAGEIAIEEGALDVVLAADPPRRRALWELRSGIGEAVRALGPSAELDLAVPRGALAPFVRGVRDIADRAGLRAVAFGHAADGNVHVHLYKPSGRRHEPAAAEGRTGGRVTVDSNGDTGLFEATAAALYAHAIRLGGTVTGEHGVGVTSRDHLPLQRSPAYLDALRAIRRALDPNGILNPGKILLP